MATPAPQPPNSRVFTTNEKVTGPPAAELLRHSLALSGTTEPLEILDNACGTGTLTGELFRLMAADPSSLTIKRIVAADIDDKMTGYMRNRLTTDPAWKQHANLVDSVVGDQQSLGPEKVPDGSFTHALSNFGVFFSRDDTTTLRETARILQPQGIAGFTSWKEITWWHELAIPALQKFIPDAPSLAPAVLFPARWDDAEVIKGKMEAAGFADVQTHELAFTPEVEGRDFAEACAVLIRVMTGRMWTPEQNKEFGGQIEDALLKYLGEKYADGKWDGKIKALITVGRKT